MCAFVRIGGGACAHRQGCAHRSSLVRQPCRDVPAEEGAVGRLAVLVIQKILSLFDAGMTESVALAVAGVPAGTYVLRVSGEYFAASELVVVVR